MMVGFNAVKRAVSSLFVLIIGFVRFMLLMRGATVGLVADEIEKTSNKGEGDN